MLIIVSICFFFLENQIFFLENIHDFFINNLELLNLVSVTLIFQISKLILSFIYNFCYVVDLYYNFSNIHDLFDLFLYFYNSFEQDNYYQQPIVNFSENFNIYQNIISINFLFFHCLYYFLTFSNDSLYLLLLTLNIFFSFFNKFILYYIRI